MPQTILIVDDDPAQRRLLQSVVGAQGYTTVTAQDGIEALTILRDPQKKSVDVMLLDLVMPGKSGMDVLAEIRPERPDLPVIVLTANGSVTTVVQAMQSGANDFIVKPASPERLQVSIRNALKINVLAGEVSRLKRKADGTLRFEDLIARSLVMRQSIKLAERAAQSNIPILIEGESGVGKEVMARAIQGGSERVGRPFVAVNCGAIPENLVESILFGHEKGSFTGATEKRLGKFQEANGGTLFLDEVGELPLDIQVKLLRAIQEGEVDPVGGKKPVKVDIRLISATNKDLQQLVDEGKFREDLFYRLNVFPLSLPTLRDRREDIPELIEHFIRKFAIEEGRNVSGIEPSALQLLSEYPWPGNVRQLENIIYRAVVLSDRELLTLHDFPQLVAQAGSLTEPITPSSATLDGEGLHPRPPMAEGFSPFDVEGHMRTLAEVEGEMIEMAIRKYDGRMSEVARRLGIGRSTLYRKVRELGLEVRESA
ncbi:MAG: sigma-54 dependent transcriptional regulator [Neomegalonema sp.]|nr:sigma-54 dependent transcriptional regulator [Neomegalonema sp.]